MRICTFRQMIAAACTLSAALASTASTQAQQWPEQTIRIVVAYGPGGGTDIVARIVGQSLQEKLGQTVIVENRVGASGIIGADSVARAPKDGYTLYLINNAHIILGVMQKSLPYDTITSFAPVGQVATGGLVIVTHPDFPATNIKQLIEAAKTNPGKITFASVGAGTTQHFTGELFKQIAAVDMLHVPYRGSPAAISAVLGKHVDVLFDTVSAVLGQVQSGDLKALAVTSQERFPAIPSIPTGIESGLLPDYEVTTWYGLVAPFGTPAPVIAKLNQTLSTILSEDVVRTRLEKAGALPRGSSPVEFQRHMESELVRWNGVRQAAGIPQQ